MLIALHMMTAQRARITTASNPNLHRPFMLKSSQVPDAALAQEGRLLLLAAARLDVSVSIPGKRGKDDAFSLPLRAQSDELFAGCSCVK